MLKFNLQVILKKYIQRPLLIFLIVLMSQGTRDYFAKYRLDRRNCPTIFAWDHDSPWDLDSHCKLPRARDLDSH